VLQDPECPRFKFWSRHLLLRLHFLMVSLVPLSKCCNSTFK